MTNGEGWSEWIYDFDRFSKHKGPIIVHRDENGKYVRHKEKTSNIIIKGHLYKTKSDRIVDCIHVEDNLAWMRLLDKDIAYVWFRDGKAKTLNCSPHLYDVDWSKQGQQQIR